MKRIVTIQDISCVGKCSLTVALPVISACGVEAAVIPTAVLSTHTGFSNFTFRDLTDEIYPITAVLKKENITFDAIYTGYLGSPMQLQLMEKFFEDFGTRDNLIFVDPVLGDHGELYPGFTQEFADKMAKLCTKADVIVPNLTEACFMLHEEYIESGYSEEYIKNILKKLSESGCKNVVLTGVSFNENELGVMAYNSDTDTYFSYFTEKAKLSFPGTGDVFSSACVGALMRGLTLEKALVVAVNFTLEAIKASIKDPAHRWYSVNFEQALPFLIDELKKNT